MEKFYLSEYLSQTAENENSLSFRELCDRAREGLAAQWEDERREDLPSMLQLQKKALIGYENEVAYFKSRIRELVKELDAEQASFPPWYESLTDGIYHEVWGLAGMSQWFSEAYRSSSSAKIIGDRIYFLEGGKMRLMPQRMDRERREQLLRAFLLLTPEERLDRDFHEIYLLDGTRITVFGGAMVKEGQDVVIFRRYVIPEYSFEEQASRGTIPEEAIPLFRAMVEAGYNVAFTGAVRTAKTSFLCTWQSYEDRSLEGVMVETDPEIPLHQLMPEAPVVQLLADNEKLKTISKNLLRSDADYFVLAEARDGNALDTALRIAGKGVRRMKITFHSGSPLRFPWDVAWEIVRSMGGDMELTARKAAASFDYVFHFIQMKDKGKKRLKSIYEMQLDPGTGEIVMTPLCLYDPAGDRWRWRDRLGEEKEKAGLEEDPEALLRIREALGVLAAKFPMEVKDHELG
ncbi:MAG: hypothetical protein Q4C22_05850 [Bacillota bacterium]|nr:hypothetical protein [Bacillota bacterium]